MKFNHIFLALPIMYTFVSVIEIIGVNPFVFLPEPVLRAVFAEAGRSSGPIPVKGTIDGHPYLQTLVRYAGHWRLYLNGPMLKISGKKVGDKVVLGIAYDPQSRIVEVPPPLAKAFETHPEAKAKFDALAPSRQKEINRYIGRLKQEETIARNVQRALDFLSGKGSFVGRRGDVE